jgi:hypothetical protein
MMFIDGRARRSAGEGWMRFCSSALALVLLSAGAQSAEVKATFITGTWATEEGCEKVAKLAAGSVRSVTTVPETLTQDGYETWEGGCTFSDIKETEPGRKWSAKTACVEGADEWTGDETMELDASGKKLTVTVEDKTTVFVRCEGEKGK